MVTKKLTEISQARPGGPFAGTLLEGVDTSQGATDAGKVVLLNPAGRIDFSMELAPSTGAFDIDDGTFLAPSTIFVMDDGTF